MDRRLHILILAGGAGRRLWPWSRPGRRKPELPLVAGKSPLEEAIEASLSLVPPERLHLVAADGYISNPGPCRLISEERGRNTLPAVAKGASDLFGMDPESVALVLPADQHFVDRDLLRVGLQKTCRELLEDSGRFFIHGTESDPHSSFGCIVANGDRLIRFVEKPDMSECESIHDLRDHEESIRTYRHCGIFGFGTDFLIKSLEARGCSTPAELPEISLDHYLLSDSNFLSSLTFQPLGHRWSDLGDWRVVRDFRRLDNSNSGVVMISCESCLGLRRYLDGEPYISCGAAPVISGTIDRRIVAVGMPEFEINVDSGQWNVVVQGKDHISEKTILLNSTGELVQIHGMDGGLVVCMEDLFVVCSEKSLESGDLSEVSKVFDSELREGV